MIILGIDPGFDRMGCAVLEKTKNGEKLVYSTCLTSDRKAPYEKRLLSLGEKLEKIMNKYKPDITTVEKLFLFKNQKTIMGVAEARGMVLYLAAKKNICIKEFTPLEIKMALTGYGRAEKSQVQSMVKAILKLEKKVKFDDEMDAIACAITCSSTSLPRAH
ncbi:MAG: crossover junction endodeoxyribonuclease RuvC [Candidatus Moranbacteria bacterium]|jgi:crossover junction endodeoxyribonuclease RuvC|nr:crossover junction endodeoxyribonuclease RuvC [Candidatus Moranbacteria bacterium]